MAIGEVAAKPTKVGMGGIAFGQAPTVLETLLGSCIGVAVWDRDTKMGGLAHVVLPESRGKSSAPGKFADTAVSELRREMVRRGANTKKLTAKIAGGATMFGQRTNQDIGQKNDEAVREHLQTLGIPLIGEHTGGTSGRVIRFSLEDGSVTVKIGREIVTVL